MYTIKIYLKNTLLTQGMTKEKYLESATRFEMMDDYDFEDSILKMRKGTSQHGVSLDLIAQYNIEEV